MFRGVITGFQSIGIGDAVVFSRRCANSETAHSAAAYLANLAGPFTGRQTQQETLCTVGRNGIPFVQIKVCHDPVRWEPRPRTLGKKPARLFDQQQLRRGICDQGIAMPGRRPQAIGTTGGDEFCSRRLCLAPVGQPLNARPGAVGFSLGKKKKKDFLCLSPPHLALRIGRINAAPGDAGHANRGATDRFLGRLARLKIVPRPLVT